MFKIKNEQYGNIDLNLDVNQQERFLALKKLLSSKNGHEKFSLFLSGFVEGEGSLWISINLYPKSSLGVKINFGFSIAQHQSGLPLLLLIRDYFKTGRVYLKSGSLNVWVFEINSRTSLSEKVVPFFKKHVLPFTCKFGNIHQGTFYHFNYVLDSFLKKKHLDKDGLIECIQHIYKTNPFGKGKKRKRSLDEIISLIKLK